MCNQVHQLTISLIGNVPITFIRVDPMPMLPTRVYPMHSEWQFLFFFSCQCARDIVVYLSKLDTISWFSNLTVINLQREEGSDI